MMVDELTMNQLGLFTPADLYAPPQHVDPRPPWCMVSQAILALLRGRFMHDPASELPRIPIPRTPLNKIRTWPLLPLPRGLPFPSSAVERPSLVSDKAARLVHDGELGLGRIRELHDGQPLTWNAAPQLKKKGPINRPPLSLVLTPIYLSDCPTTVWPPRLVTVHVWDLDLQLPLVSLLFGLVVVV